MEEEYSVMQLIDGNGKFNSVGLDKFVKAVKLVECRHSYVVAAIMGIQSSGKSTLMNHLFRTKFKEMNAKQGRNQTTRGIWMAKAKGVDIEPCTIAMDLEGNDGKKTDQATAFEKFALAVSDIVLVNMQCSDIGLENSANKALLRTICEVLLHSFDPDRWKTLLFVIRDSSETPIELLRYAVLNDISKTWDEVPKPLTHKYTSFDKIFKVELVALPHYGIQKKKFKEEVVHLRNRLLNTTYQGELATTKTKNRNLIN